ncbi:MAG TPA: DUF5615 family PIN-like protein [Longimicrobiaceae bacterium]|nr:DUF5615 family PIN-like protein [Longimicrobiaceae bacterium]
MKRRVLLDENLPRLLSRDLSEHEVQTVADAGWAGTRNGALLRLAESAFDVFVTADRNLEHQQTLAKLDLGVVLIAAGSTKLGDLRPLAGEIASAITSVAPGHLVRVPAREPTAGPDPSS